MQYQQYYGMSPQQLQSFYSSPMDMQQQMMMAGQQAQPQIQQQQMQFMMGAPAPSPGSGYDQQYVAALMAQAQQYQMAIEQNQQ